MWRSQESSGLLCLFSRRNENPPRNMTHLHKLDQCPSLWMMLDSSDISRFLAFLLSVSCIFLPFNTSTSSRMVGASYYIWCASVLFQRCPQSGLRTSGESGTQRFRASCFAKKIYRKAVQQRQVLISTSSASVVAGVVCLFFVCFSISKEHKNFQEETVL